MTSDAISRSRGHLFVGRSEKFRRDGRRDFLLLHAKTGHLDEPASSSHPSSFVEHGG
jgi:hypothetical protein